jgi:hypothetical protein
MKDDSRFIFIFIFIVIQLYLHVNTLSINIYNNYSIYLLITLKNVLKWMLKRYTLNMRVASCLTLC